MTEWIAELSRITNETDDSILIIEPRWDINPDIAEAILASERAVAEGMGVGQVIITAGFGGFIVAYENFGGAQWL